MNYLAIVIAGAVVLVAAACRDEGPMERAGRQADEAVEAVKEESEGALDRLEREVDQAVEGTRSVAKEAEEEVRKAVEAAKPSAKP